jgi:hypothetical protein
MRIVIRNHNEGCSPIWDNFLQRMPMQHGMSTINKHHTSKYYSQLIDAQLACENAIMVRDRLALDHVYLDFINPSDATLFMLKYS